MSITDLREELSDARQQIKDGHPESALEHIDRALEELNTPRLTTTQAKDWLGLGSVNTLKLLVAKAGLVYGMHGNRMMIPRSELEKLRDSSLLRGIQSADRLHEESEGLGTPDGLSEQELQELEDSRPGSPPWRKKRPVPAV